jgi:hypothetical protein
MIFAQRPDPLVQIGNALLRGVARVYTSVPDFWNVAPVILIIGAALLGLVIYRDLPNDSDGSKPCLEATSLLQERQRAICGSSCCVFCLDWRRLGGTRLSPWRGRIPTGMVALLGQHQHNVGNEGDAHGASRGNSRAHHSH